MISRIKYISKALLIAMPLLFISCKAKQKQPEKQVVIQLKKTACYGQCPIYTFTIYSDYTCIIQPKEFAPVDTLSHSNLTKKELEKLIQFATEINFWGFENEYNNKQVSDLPSSWITFSQNNQTKTIHSRMGSPKPLIEFIKKVEKTVNTRQWNTVQNKQ